MSSFDELELAELREAFNEFDKVPSMISRPSCLHEVHRVLTVLCQDGSGTISTEELLHVLRAMGQNPSEEELNNTIMEIDIDGSGTIDFFEFVNLMRDKANEVDIDNDIRCESVNKLLQIPPSQE